MKKFLLSLAALAVASSAAFAETCYTVDFATTAIGNAENQATISSWVNSYEKEYSYTLNSNTTAKWDIQGFNPGQSNTWGHIRGGRKGGASTAYIESAFAMPELINEVQMTVTASVADKVTSIELQISDTNTWAEGTYTSIPTDDKGAGDIIFKIAEPKANMYYRLYFSFAQNTNGFYRVSKIVYNGEIGNPDLKSPEVAFPAADYIAAVGEAFEAPKATTASTASIVYSSSDTNVATVDAATGAVTVVAKGTAIITAKVEETSEYRGGSATYTLTVASKGADLKELATLCPATGDKAIVGCPLTVVYVNGMNVYVVDAAGNSGLLYGANSYKAGDVIPANWLASFKDFNGLPEWEGIFPAADGTAEVVIPSVEAVSTADINRVVVLNNVKFAAATPAREANGKGTNFTGVLKAGEGENVTFRTNWEIASVEAGTYDVTCAVAYYKNDTSATLQVYPISYAKTGATTIADTISADAAEAVYYNLQGVRVANPTEGLYIKVQGGKSVKVMLKK